MQTDRPTEREPHFDELPFVDGSEERHAWDVWGRQDQIGSMNWLGPEQVQRACGLVTTGRVVGLTCALNEPDITPSSRRAPYSLVVHQSRFGRDDRLDGLYPQYTSQWDGLRHVRFRQHGYWGGRQEEDLDRSEELGIHHWAQRGIVGRGVLLDVARHLATRGETVQPDERRPYPPELLDEVAVAEGVELRRGDVLIVRTGWLEWFLECSPERRAEMHGTLGGGAEVPLACPGLDGRRETAAWVWDQRLAAVAVDNPAVEALPVLREDGFLHHRLIPLLGVALGEMWLLRELATLCAEANRYEFLFMAGVLNVPGGSGSPANAYAVF